MRTLETIDTVLRWIAALIAVIAAVGIIVTRKEYTGRFPHKVHWIRAIASVTTALLMILILWLGSHLDQLRTGREQANVNELAQTKPALDAMRTETQPRTLSLGQSERLLPLLHQTAKGISAIDAVSGDAEA
jgi:ABC-type proline/glycine betaine transport system permease subunit